MTRPIAQLIPGLGVNPLGTARFLGQKSLPASGMPDGPRFGSDALPPSAPKTRGLFTRLLLFPFKVAMAPFKLALAFLTYVLMQSGAVTKFLSSVVDTMGSMPGGMPMGAPKPPQAYPSTGPKPGESSQKAITGEILGPITGREAEPTGVIIDADMAPTYEARLQHLSQANPVVEKLFAYLNQESSLPTCQNKTFLKEMAGFMAEMRRFASDNMDSEGSGLRQLLEKGFRSLDSDDPQTQLEAALFFANSFMSLYLPQAYPPFFDGKADNQFVLTTTPADSLENMAVKGGWAKGAEFYLDRLQNLPEIHTQRLIEAMGGPDLVGVGGLTQVMGDSARVVKAYELQGGDQAPGVAPQYRQIIQQYKTNLALLESDDPDKQLEGALFFIEMVRQDQAIEAMMMDPDPEDGEA